MYWNKREIARAQNTNTHTHIIETRNSDANPATCSFRRAFRYIEDQIKSSHRISIRLLNTISESVFDAECTNRTLYFCVPDTLMLFLARFLCFGYFFVPKPSFDDLSIDFECNIYTSAKNNLIGNKCNTFFCALALFRLFCLGHKSL